jgi:diketogulonate reductase-like aldo/keto reductase
MEEFRIGTKAKLNNGVEMPMFGLGTYQAQSGREAREAVLHALGAGYRHIDTASMYGNEEDVGTAIRESGNLRNETWRALETLLKEQKCRAIGVSNYMIRHLEELLGSSSTVPAVNQVEFSPYLYQKDLLEFCRKHKVQLEAYSPLTKGHKLNDPKLVALASTYSKSPAQILIRWALQREIVVIPKSSSKQRITENAAVFDFTISPEDMSALDSFDQGLRTSWDPSTAP